MLEEGLASSVSDALDQPLDLCITILNLRAYAQAKRAVDAATKPEDMPEDTPIVRLVGEIYADQMREEIARRKAQR